MKRITPFVLIVGLSVLLMSSDCGAGPADSEVNQTVRPDGMSEKIRPGKAGEVSGRFGLDNTPAGGTLPGGTLPGGTLPGGTLPSGTLPGGTVPGGTVQSKKLPGE